MENSEEIRVPTPEPPARIRSYDKRSKNLPENREYAIQRREELKRLAEEARIARKEKAKALHDRRSEIALSNREARRAKKAEAGALEATQPTAEEELALKRAKRNKRVRNWKAKKRAADSERKRRLHNANQRRYQRRKQKRERAKRWAAIREAAAAKRIAKAKRKAERERKAAERAAQELAEGAKKKPSPYQKRLNEAVTAALQEGIRIGKQQALAEFQAQKFQTT